MKLSNLLVLSLFAASKANKDNDDFFFKKQDDDFKNPALEFFDQDDQFVMDDTSLLPLKYFRDMLKEDKAKDKAKSKYDHNKSNLRRGQS